MPSTEHETFVEMMTSIPRRDDVPLQEQRDNYAAILAGNPLPEHVEIRNVDIGAASADWVEPPKPRRDRVVLYLHGGGYVIGSSTAYHEFGARMAGAAAYRDAGQRGPADPSARLSEQRSGCGEVQWLIPTAIGAISVPVARSM